MTKLAGRVALITGAARGIGAETARRLAAAGAHVSLVGLEPDLLQKVAAELGDDHTWFEADVTDQASIDAAVAGTVDRFGRIDIVMANAGVAAYGTVRMHDPDAFARTVDVNLTGVFRTVHAALPHVIERKGHVLIVSSVAAFAALPGMTAYCASKSGVDALAGALRQEVAHLGVTVGSAHPSWIDTDMVREAERDLSGFSASRSSLPWPVRSTTSVDECADAMTRGIIRRSHRVYVPRAVGILNWLRPLLASPPAARAASRIAADIVPKLEAEIEGLGRSFGRHVKD